MKKLLVTGASGFIGTNLVDYYMHRELDLLNVDIQKPLDPAHIDFWKKGNILDASEMEAIFAEYQPTHVIHMAARADCDENTTVEAGYSANTIGTENVLNAISKTPSIDRTVIVSTQYVAGPSRLPVDDTDYFPHTVYGMSKVITERLVRNAEIGCVWTLVRPTNIWGPWHMRYRREAWRVINKGMYMHPGQTPVMRSYGYVGNVIWQMDQILKAPRETVDRQVFYVGDRPDDIYKWVNAFSTELRGKPVRRVPRRLVALLGRVGDLLAKAGTTFPITSSRYNNMISDYHVPIDKTFDTFGSPPFSLQQGVTETVRWLKQIGW